MKRLIITLTAILFLASLAIAQNIVTPVFPHKDGEASATNFTGSEKDIQIDGGLDQVVGWVIFQTSGVDLTGISSAMLALYVKSLDAPGTLNIHGLSAPIVNPENNVLLASIAYNPTATATVSLGTADIEKVILLDITALITAGSFYGIALVSEDGLVAMLDAKEGNLPPLVMLTHNVQSTADKWHIGSGVPAVSIGKNGDLYLDNVSADVYTKSAGAWSIALNIKGLPGIAGTPGAKGDKGDKGDQGDQGIQGVAGADGVKGDKGDKGDQGIQGVIGEKGDKGDKGDQGDTGPIAGNDKQFVYNNNGAAAGAELYYNSKNVGIGTDSPGANLEIKGNLTKQLTGVVTVSPSSTLLIGNGTLFITELTIGDAVLITNEIFTVASITSAVTMTLNTPHTAGALNVPAYTDHNLLSLKSGTDEVKMVIDKSGNVGIGTTEPTEKLEVNGTIKATAFVGGGNLVIGDSYGGGIIFWLDASGKHGLIAATSDQSTGIQWYNGTYLVTGATLDGVYAGQENTNRIISTQGVGSYAAQVCADYSVTVNNEYYDDWYLPSKYELNLMYVNKYIIGGFATVTYCSSSEYDNSNAWFQFFSGGNQYSDAKYLPRYVRAVRAF